MGTLLAASNRTGAAAAIQPDDVAEFRHELRTFHAAPYGVILDAGCGAGDVTRHLAERFPTNIVIGVDSSAAQIAQAKAGGRLPNISFSVAELAHLKLDDDSIDQIVCRFALQKLAPDARQAVLREFLRVLKPYGAIAVIDFDGFAIGLHPVTQLLADTAREMDGGKLAGLPVGRQLPGLLVAAGFEDVLHEGQDALAQAGPACAERHAMRLGFDEAALDAGLGAPGCGRQLHLDLAACLASQHASLAYRKSIVTAIKPGVGG